MNASAKACMTKIKKRRMDTMKKLLFVAVATTMFAVTALGETATDATLHESFAAKAGGLVGKPNSSKGKIVFVNTQSEIGEANISGAISSLGEIIAKYAVSSEKDTPDKPMVLKAKHKADIAVIIVAEDEAPALLAAPEENWAVVNVRALKRNLKSDAAVEKFFDSRCRKEIMRGFVCAAGGMGSSFPGNIMNVAKVEDLDLCDEFVPFDKVGLIKQHLKNNGVMPVRYATYRIACREGWAPAPTNDTQKAIWDKVHEMPSEPIKIKPEEKKTEK